ncbi:hypothetical protein MLD38_031650 [Melastoma candidum]|uniref:Uncharacterized protein n=1 Tax=Melastoma candidum TaxID=119954 RepID=A0ACB9MQB9_9MYRT|nr:hypothetical protein MLD38_031650 [Melastoma candidum]
MANNERDVVPMLSAAQRQLSDEMEDQSFHSFAVKTRSASMSMPLSTSEPYESLPPLVGHTGPLQSARRLPSSQFSGPLYITHTKPERTSKPNPTGSWMKEPQQQKFPSFRIQDDDDSISENYTKNTHLMRSGQLGMCNDPYCTTCPTYYKAGQQKPSKSSAVFDQRFHNVLYEDAKGWARRFYSYIRFHIPGVMNPHAKFVQQWNKFFVISCMLAVFMDPLFFFLLTTNNKYYCIELNHPMTTTLVFSRSITDIIYFLHILLQFRLAYVSPETRVVGAGDLEDHPRKIAIHYLRSYFFIDLFVALPLPQIVILSNFSPFKASAGANNAKNMLRATVLIQEIPRLYRVFPLLAGQSPTGFIFESAWANFVLNLLTFVLAGHVVGSCWYLLGLQRVNQCFRDACSNVNLCDFTDCVSSEVIEERKGDSRWNLWINNTNASACYTGGSFDFGIYVKAVNLSADGSIVTRYVYSLFWGFQQISTLAGNQVPSYFWGEVMFTMGIIGMGLLLFALLIGNMQNFLQSLGRRRLEMQLRRRDVEQWMSHRRLPENLRRRVRLAERYSWAATRGVNEEILLENLPEDVQIDIRRHLFKFVKKVRIFALMDDIVSDAICEKLRQKTYIAGSRILYRDGLLDKMFFIVRGKILSTGEDGEMRLSEGDICGEELLAWCLESSAVPKDGRKMRAVVTRQRSTRTVTCLTNVEAFALRAEDLEEVTSVYARYLRNPHVQGAIRYVSPFWRGRAVTIIQVAWRYRKKRLSRADTAGSETPLI